jgi:hypothetical protein
MIAPTIAQRYVNRYPGQGRVAVLCEGDLAGYEADLIARLTAQYGYVDVMPCGTKTAIFGMCDAIGRSIPVVALEDRDYRNCEDARADCNRSMRDRQARGVQVRVWRAWQRNEIENYLVEPSIVIPTLAAAFGVEDQAVEDRLTRVVKGLGVDQAAQWTISAFQTTLPEASDFRPGLPHKTARPQWTTGEQAMVVPPIEVVRVQLRCRFEEVAKAFGRKASALGIDDLLSQFEDKNKQWSGLAITEDPWRIDWSGKEVLTSLCRWLASDFGWPADGISERKAVDWEVLSSERRDGVVDREIASVLQPYLVQSFCEAFGRGLPEAIHDEWMEIIKAIVQAAHL